MSLLILKMVCPTDRLVSLEKKMIARITGKLLELDSKANTILLEVGAIVYEVLAPGYTISELSMAIGRDITLYTLEFYEGNSASASSFIPRIVGFPQQADKAFFLKFTSVKGIGMKKALRAMSQRPSDIAWSIESGDSAMLKTLPEIGKRTAEQIIAELKGKMSEFSDMPAQTPGKATRVVSSIEKEALEILIQLGEQAATAQALIDKVLKAEPEIEATDQLVQAVYRVKG